MKIQSTADAEEPPNRLALSEGEDEEPPDPEKANYCPELATPCARERLFPGVSQKEWDDWRWQLKHRLRWTADLESFLTLSGHEKMTAGPRSRDRLPLSITPYYSTLIDRSNPMDPIRRCVIPTCYENVVSPGEAEDPLGEDEDSPVPGLVHRYPDRVLFLATNKCSVYCRYCTRSRSVGRDHLTGPMKAHWESCLSYIEQHREVRDVLVSGGDPLVLADDTLDWLLGRLRRIQHVEIIRIGTKAPVVLPQRITPALVLMLRKHHPLWINIHFTHPREITEETSRACEYLADAGIPLGSQTVLLKGINDNVLTMAALYKGLLRLRVRPYYLYQCDRIRGSAHFITPVSKGLEIIRGLRGHTTGLAVPNYVIDAPGGGGKVPLLPQYFLGKDQGDVLLENYAGRVFRYADPENMGVEAADFAGISA
jgi:lysine 2,3-aminomutase